MGAVDAVMVNFEIPEETVRAVVEAGHARGVPVIVDAGPPRHYAPETWCHASVLSPNRLETETLVGHALPDDAGLERAAQELLARGPAAIVLKLGARGALACTAAGNQWVPGYHVPVVDTTGAGDAFTAGLALALAEGRPLGEAVRFANAAGAVAVTRLGALSAMPTRQEVAALMGRPT
jgi:ribokinase